MYDFVSVKIYIEYMKQFIFNMYTYTYTYISYFIEFLTYAMFTGRILFESRAQ